MNWFDIFHKAVEYVTDLTSVTTVSYFTYVIDVYYIAAVDSVADSTDVDSVSDFTYFTSIVSYASIASGA